MNKYNVLATIIFVAVLSACGSILQTDQKSTQSNLQDITLSEFPTPITSPIINGNSTPTTTNIPTAVFPLTIESMRARDYPGSDISIEQTLSPGSNFYRYIVSYISEGLKINALLTIPFGEKPGTGWPVIIFNHGFIPPTQYRTTERYINYINRLASAGYIVFRSDYRGHDQSQGLARGAYGYPDYVVDVINGLQSIKTLPEVDAERIGMWGHSMGGYITLRSMVIQNDIKAGVIWAGVVGSYQNLLKDWPQTTPPIYELDPSWRKRFIDEFGDPEVNPEFWASISATNFLEDISGPLQLHHSISDNVVPFEFSNKLFHELIIAGKTTELYAYQDDNHNIAINFNLAMDRTLEFFNRYLKADP